MTQNLNLSQQTLNAIICGTWRPGGTCTGVAKWRMRERQQPVLDM